MQPSRRLSVQGPTRVMLPTVASFRAKGMVASVLGATKVAMKVKRCTKGKWIQEGL